MRVLNKDALKGDLDVYFCSNALLADEIGWQRKFFTWLEKAWVKHFLKSHGDGFVWPVVPNRMPSFFKDESDSGPEMKLKVELPYGDLKLQPETEWDEKDAEAGTLLYYAPHDRTLAFFVNEIADVRDYIRALLEEDPNADLSKRSWQDAVRASEAWHEDQQRRMRALMEAQAAIAKANNQSVFENLVSGVDYWLASDNPIMLNGRSYVLVRLASQRALTYESSIMDHCVHSYGKELYDGHTVLLSVREASSISIPLITVEVQIPEATNAYGFPRVIQVRGMHNHDAEQTIKGITDAVKQEALRLPTKGTASLRKTEGDLSFKVDLPDRP